MGDQIADYMRPPPLGVRRANQQQPAICWKTQTLERLSYQPGKRQFAIAVTLSFWPVQTGNQMKWF